MKIELIFEYPIDGWGRMETGHIGSYKLEHDGSKIKPGGFRMIWDLLSLCKKVKNQNGHIAVLHKAIQIDNIADFRKCKNAADVLRKLIDRLNIHAKEQK